MNKKLQQKKNKIKLQYFNSLKLKIIVNFMRQKIFNDFK